jgi:hypothetical protein
VVRSEASGGRIDNKRSRTREPENLVDQDKRSKHMGVCALTGVLDGYVKFGCRNSI